MKSDRTVALINMHRRSFHLPQKFEDGGEALVWVDEDGNPLPPKPTKEEKRKRRQQVDFTVVDRDRASFRGLLPAAVFDARSQLTTPGRLEVPEWYVDQLLTERGWQMRFERGGGVEVDGMSISTAVDEKEAEIARLRSELREARLKAGGADAAESRAKALEDELAALKKSAATTPSTPAASGESKDPPDEKKSKKS